MKIKNVISIILISLMIVFSSTYVYATPGEIVQSTIKLADKDTKKEDTDINLENAISGADKFLKKGEEQVDESEIQQASNSLVNIFMAAGMIIAVVYVGILGIKYMFGAVEEKAEIKETLIPFIVGCVVVFGAFTIWKLIILIGSNI